MHVWQTTAEQCTDRDENTCVSPWKVIFMYGVEYFASPGIDTRRKPHRQVGWIHPHLKAAGLAFGSKLVLSCPIHLNYVSNQWIYLSVVMLTIINKCLFFPCQEDHIKSNSILDLLANVSALLLTSAMKETMS